MQLERFEIRGVFVFITGQPSVYLRNVLLKRERNVK